MTQDKGKVTVGVTKEGAAHLKALLETGWFESEMAAYLLAISVALARALVVSQTSLVGVTTKYNVGSLDRDGRLRDLLRLMGPKPLKDPYEYAEKLADSGLEFLKERLVDQELLLSVILNPNATSKSGEGADNSSDDQSV